MKGQIDIMDIMILIISVVAVVFLFVIGANLVLDTSADAAGKSNLTYRTSVVSERIINSPCTTEGRGIFIEEDLKAGRFDCLNLSGVYIHFAESSDERGRTANYYFSFPEDGEGVRAITGNSFREATRYENGSFRGVSVRSPVTVYSSSEDFYYQGWMEVFLG